MGWFSDLGDGMNKSFSSLPDWCKSIVKIALWLSLGAFMVATFGELTHGAMLRMLPVTTEDIHKARLKAEVESLEAESISAARLASARTNAQIEMEAAKADANRLSLGLPTRSTPKSSDSLASLGAVVTENLPTILAIMFAVYLLPTFSSTGDPWRLGLNISAAIVLSGLYALLKGINSPAAVEAKIAAGSIAITSTSVGLCLMLFGTVLAGFCLYMLSQKKALDKGGEVQ